MLCKFYLFIRDEFYPLGKDCVKNWDEINYSIKRADYSGTSRSFTSQFEFVNAAYNIILKEYLKNYVYAEASISVHTINNNHAFSEEFRARLDFGTLKYSNKVLSINAFDDSLAALIKAKKGTQYEYPVEELKEEKALFYDRLIMQNAVNYIFGGSTNDDGNSFYDFNIKFAQGRYFSPFISILNEEILYHNNLEFNVDESFDTPTGGRIERYALVKNPGEDAVMVSFDIDFDFYITDLSDSSIKVSFAMHKSDTDASVFESGKIGIGVEQNVKFKRDVLVSPGVYVYFNFYVYLDGGGWDAIIGKVVTRSRFVKLSFFSRGESVNIDVVSPGVLLNRLLKSINDDKEGIICEIKSGIDSRLDKALIVPAESARGITGAMLYSSYTKFADWMSTMFGFVPVIGVNTVSFVHRDSLYSNKAPISIGNCIDSLEYSVKDSLIYSVVRAGFEKKKYESINGRDEFHWTNEFSTGVTITDNELKLASPYRADPYGIEFLVQKRGKDTTDSDSDNDVFFVCAELDSTNLRYILVRTGYEVSGVISPATMFNSMYSPRSIIEANRKFIGVTIDKLTFASSDGNSDVVINGIAETDDIVISPAERLFTAGEVSFVSAGRLSHDEDVAVEVERDGKLYTGYMSERSFKLGRYNGVSYKLQVKSIVDL